MDIAARLDAARRELLDLSLRNPLLNHRVGKARGVRIVDEVPAEVFRILWQDEAAMRFAGAKAETEAETDQAPADLPPPSEPAARHNDRVLQTAHVAEKLQARLIATARDARLVAEERGVNVLALALGYLKWREPEATGDTWRAAPLYLLPVQLARASAGAQFVLTAADDDPRASLTLQVKLKAEFGLTLPDPPGPDDLDLTAWFAQVAAAIADRPGWAVEPRLHLDLFSFGRYLMYRDLDPAAWPLPGLGERPLVRRIFAGGFAPLPDTPDLDASRPAERIGEVVDSDASQAAALAAVAAGADLVIQGPPGTGKSQTICNLIAQAVAQGKRVLFVAEKMAALAVVQRRLAAVGLGDLCLELHSDQAAKRVVMAELGRTLKLTHESAPPQDGTEATYAQVRGELNELAQALRHGIGTRMAPGAALDRIADIAGIADLPRLPDLPDVPPERAAAQRAAAAELQAAIRRCGPLPAHPFGGSRLTQVLPADDERIAAAVAAASHAVAPARAAAGPLAAALGLPIAHAAALGERLAQAQHWLAKPAAVADPAHPGWADPALEALLAALRQAAAIRAQYDATLIPEAWDQDLVQVRADLAAYGEGFFRIMSGAWRAAAGRLKGLCRGPCPKDHPAQLALVDAVLAWRRQAAGVRTHDALGKALFGQAWWSERSDAAALAAAAQWAAVWRRFPAAQPQASLATVVPPAAAAAEALRLALAQLAQALRWDAEHALGDDAWPDLEARLDAARSRPGSLHDVCAVNRAAEALADLPQLVALARTWALAGTRLVDALDAGMARAALDAALAARPVLARFDAAAHARCRARFAELDRQVLERNRRVLRATHRRGLPAADERGPVALVRREAEKKTRHLPLRQLLREAGEAVQRIKPVFLMSPLSVAAYLEPGGPTFDLVVFDEASQVRPVDALGALARAQQAVVVGDSRQMPPTSFFDRMVAGEDESDSPTADLESLLGLFLGAGCPEAWLEWHYRSRHPSLIAVSNAQFYHHRLRVFPSPAGAADPAGEGLSYRHLPDAVYDRARTRVNPREAEAIAAAVIEHARTRPQWSLGVAAFSQAQSEAIATAIEHRRRSDAGAEGFFAAHPHEPFFVKNLENVQGDERDCILVSVGYGRDADGQVAMNFGPLNVDGGERRLNVLITRARRRQVVYTNLAPEDIDPSRTQARGVLALRAFLQYARDGHLPGADTVPASGVAARLGAALPGSVRVGTAGLAWRRGNVGIALDDDTWVSARTCRDRERLTDEVLTGLGWQVHRAWRLGWWRRPDDEVGRVPGSKDEG